jgi:hypothetical protein
MDATDSQSLIWYVPRSVAIMDSTDSQLFAAHLSELHCQIQKARRNVTDCVLPYTSQFIIRYLNWDYAINVTPNNTPWRHVVCVSKFITKDSDNEHRHTTVYIYFAHYVIIL